MPLLENILIHGTTYAILFTVYLLAIMRGLSPRIWGFSDYPKEITEIVEPKSKRERQIGAIIGIPFFIIMFGFPIISTLILELEYNGSIPLLDAFLNIFGLMLFGTVADLLILDLLIVGTITPQWVIIPGTEHLKETEYKNFRAYHAKGHAKALIPLILLCFIVALIIAIV